MKKKEERERANPGRLFQQHLKNYSADHTEKKATVTSNQLSTTGFGELGLPV